MHIVYVTSELRALGQPPRGGLASFVANIARLMSANGNKVEIIFVSTKKESLLFDDDIKVHYVYIPKYEWDEYDLLSKELYNIPNERSEFRKAFVNIVKSQKVKSCIDTIDKEKKVDIVHFSNIGGYSLMMDYSIPYVVRISGYSNIISQGAEQIDARLDFEDNPLRIRDLIEIRALKRALYTISPSILCSNIGKEALGISPYVIESPFIHNLEEEESLDIALIKEKKYILFFGSLKRNKGIHVIAESAKRILYNHKDIYIVVVGSDNEIETKNGKMMATRYIEEETRGFTDKIIYLGELPWQTLCAVIKNAYVVALPSRIDNLPNSCIEAMACGKIVVGTNGASYEQLINDGENGFLCEIDDNESFIESIERAFELSTEDRSRMEDNARKTINRMNPDVIYKHYIELYMNVIKDWDVKLAERE